MAKYISYRNPISSRALKRKETGSVVICHGGRENVKFTRVEGGWRRKRMDISEDTTVVTSAAVANECNTAVGCKESWARVY